MRSGSIVDIFAVILFVFLAAVVCLLLYFVVSVTNASGVFGSHLAAYKNFIGAVALSLPIGVAGLIVIAGVLAYYVRAHPTYLFMAIILVIFAFPVSIALASAWNSMEASATGDMVAVFADLGLLSAMIQNLPWVVVGGGAVVLVSAYMGYQREGGV